MTWKLYRWTWRVHSPLFVGATPAGSLNRCRMYVPVRPLWGALTAELTRHEKAYQSATKQDYAHIGEELRERFRFSYLYPAERRGGRWRAWLPKYGPSEGLCWERENGGLSFRDRRFRRRLLSTRPGTAIAPANGTAEAGTLRETECIQTRWRDDGGAGGPVAMVGYVFALDGEPDRLDRIRRLFIGGDTRYGLGSLVRGELLEPARDFFGEPVHLDGEEPHVQTDRLLAHVTPEKALEWTGDRERLCGWDGDRLATRASCWCPGSMAASRERWAIEPHGLWRRATV